MHRKSTLVSSLRSSALWFFAFAFALFTGITGTVQAQPSSGWHHVGQTNWNSPSTPSSIDYNGVQITVARGEHNELMYSVGGPFGLIRPGRTEAAPALTIYRGMLWLWYTGTDGNLWARALVSPGALWSEERAVFTRRVTDPRASPAIAADPTRLHVIIIRNERLYAAALQPTGQAPGPGHPPSFSGISDGVFSEIPGGARTESSPAAASTSPNGFLWVVHRGTDNRIYLQRRDLRNGAWDGNWNPLDVGTTDAAPAITYYPRRRQMLLVWRNPVTREIEDAYLDLDSGRVISAQNLPPGPGPSASGPSANATFIGCTFNEVHGNMYIFNNGPSQ